MTNSTPFCNWQSQNSSTVGIWLYPGCEVNSSSSVQQQGGDIHVTIVSSNVQRGEPTLFGRERTWRERRVKGKEVREQRSAVRRKRKAKPKKDSCVEYRNRRC